MVFQANLAVSAEIEAAELSDAFWGFGLPQALNTSSINAPAIKVFWAAQANRGDKGFLSKDITVRDMLTHHGDIHHIFPKNFLKNRGLARSRYNQVANFVFVQQEVKYQDWPHRPSYLHGGRVSPV